MASDRCPEPQRGDTSTSVAPLGLRTSIKGNAFNPGLTPWAIICRPVGAENDSLTAPSGRKAEARVIGVGTGHRSRVTLTQLQTSPTRTTPRRCPMPQSLACLHVHFVFSTKNREPFLVPDLTPRLYAYVGGILRDAGSRFI